MSETSGHGSPGGNEEHTGTPKLLSGMGVLAVYSHRTPARLTRSSEVIALPEVIDGGQHPSLYTVIRFMKINENMGMKRSTTQ
jgi:hypothetical protein